MDTGEQGDPGGRRRAVGKGGRGCGNRATVLYIGPFPVRNPGARMLHSRHRPVYRRAQRVPDGHYGAHC